jgi:hypothetical protein
MTTPRIFVSVLDDRHLTARQRALKRAILRRVEKQGFEVTVFEPEQFGVGRPKNLQDWTVDRARKRIRRCDGALVLAFAQIGSGLPTPYNHLEGALAVAHDLPLLIFLEEGIERRGIFNCDVKPFVMPLEDAPKWTNTPSFKDHVGSWAAEVHDRRDVFLGYCSEANTAAAEIRNYLEKKNFSVIDWSRDFKNAGGNILEQIERAAGRCRCAVFLFTVDDELKSQATAEASFSAVPRDNVLLEAGYFTRSHGKERVAIVREKGAKMPADLGGVIYISLKNRKKLNPVKRNSVSSSERL